MLSRKKDPWSYEISDFCQNESNLSGPIMMGHTPLKSARQPDKFEQVWFISAEIGNPIRPRVFVSA